MIKSEYIIDCKDTCLLAVSSTTSSPPSLRIKIRQRLPYESIRSFPQCGGRFYS